MVTKRTFKRRAVFARQPFRSAMEFGQWMTHLVGNRDRTSLIPRIGMLWMICWHHMNGSRDGAGNMIVRYSHAKSPAERSRLHVKRSCKLADERNLPCM